MRGDRRERGVSLLALFNRGLKDPCPVVRVPKHPAAKVGEPQLALALEALAQETEPLIDLLISQLARFALRHSFEVEAIDAIARNRQDLIAS